MQPGYFCRVLSDRVSQITMHLRPSNFPVPLDYAQTIMPTTGNTPPPPPPPVVIVIHTHPCDCVSNTHSAM